MDTERTEVDAPVETCLLTVAFDLDHLSRVRHEVGRRLAEAGLPEQEAEDFLLAVNEAMANALRHGPGSGHLRLWRDGSVVCEVADTGLGFPDGPPQRPLRPPGPRQQGGRGLWLAQQYSDELRIDSSPEGTNVRLSKALPPAPGPTPR
ncbi:ATP-binding protein [Micromonospora sp. WMMD882]|uniref:ATP-binding protein n=1 Tax=Micromonospora sp. WMMD882 TaxID=3015151 RepID=UPI00248CB943|nr:ATP-binding protein [Micromonospora sp. WMMD882]WBB81655.1 ATP-binding protein [Micromonospora sp. WMMD882]